ncbi:MAG TPA: carboxypeptidase regulatory-like domain-containing protein, partial [Pyrinomonadaceae bacterium]|nr:carboxypeptidase regulatory-like domain-containing protein [Pyrinomonadaceae bacterium]
AAPIWKTTYRVVLDDKGEPFFQGWAVVDNVSDEDWTDIRLSLISGTPVSFIQPIQKPFYRYRPVIPVPDDLRLSPQTYEPDTGESGGNTISGTVEDPNDAAVPGATVTVTDAATGKVVVTVNTNDEGRFRTPFLPPGNYVVKVEARGFRSYVSSDVRVTATRPTSLEVDLDVGGVSESVTVTGGEGREIVNATSSNYIVDGSSRSGLPQLNLLSLSEAMTSGRSGVEAAAEGGEVGDLFEYRIEQPVTVRRDRSALIPILQTRMEGSRVSVFRESEGRQRPMSGLMLKNTSPLTLEGGALTVIDGDAYAGESLLERLKPKEERLVTFALDLGTLITVREEVENAPVHTVRIVNGTLHANRYHREKKIYTLRNQTERARTVYVEHPFRQNWQLDDKLTPKPDGKTRSAYRFRVELGPNETRDFVVSEREHGSETYALSNVTPDLIQLFVSRRYIDDSTRAALEKILDIKARLAQVNARAEAVERETAEIAADQKRLRENIGALNSTAEARQLITRYVQKADQQETRLEQLTRDKQTLSEERLRLQTQLDATLRALALERELLAG